MFIPESGHSLLDDSPESPSSDEEQRYLVRNHLSLLMFILRDGRNHDRDIDTIVDAMDDILGRLDDYLVEQERERPWSWVVQSDIGTPIRRVLSRSSMLRRLDRASFESELDDVCATVDRLTRIA